MMIYKNNHKRIKTYLFASMALVAGISIASELVPEPSINTVKAPTKFIADNPTDVYTLDQGIATDRASKLIWSRCLMGQTFVDGACEGSPMEFNSWQEALMAVQSQSQNGWRLPNIKELMRITESTQVFPAINTSVFPFAKTFKFYSHDETREETDYSKRVSRANPEEVCTEMDEYDRYVDEQDWECIYAKKPAKYIAQASSPYLWSSTPIAHMPYRPKYGEELTPTQQAEKDKEQRQSANMVYALDLSEGVPSFVTRDGKAIGDTEEGKYSDEYKEKKARYILLVKDMS